jgi:large subunit ribosomal protein L3
MTIGLVGRKVGMMRIFTDEGDAQPVTVLDVSDNRITQIKTADKDGYSAVQVAFGKRRASRVKKPLAGHLAKAAVEAGHTLKEFRAEPKEIAELKVGGKIGVELFKVGQTVDVQGTTIGKGFAGVIKRQGSVPGFSGRDVIVWPAIKGQKKVVAQKAAPGKADGKPAAKA